MKIKPSDNHLKMSRLPLVLFFFLSYSVYPQQESPTFSEAISNNLLKYKEKADKAYRQDNVLRAEFLFDSLVNNCLKGARLDNFKVKDLKNKQVDLNEFQKPVYLITNSSWIVPTEGEIPAINQLADKYHDQIDFVMLFWDNQKTAKELSQKYSKNIKILYVDELKNNSSYVVKNLKHSLGFPTSFLLDKEKQIIDIQRKVSHPYGMDFEHSLELNTRSFTKAISLLLIKDSNQYSDNTSEELEEIKALGLK